MHRHQYSGKRTKQAKPPVELLAVGMIALMWAVILSGAAFNRQEPTPQPVEPTVAPSVVEAYKEARAQAMETLTPLVTEPIEEEIKRTYYGCPFDQELQDYIYDLMEKFGIDLDIAWPLAMVWNESGFDQYAVGAAGDSGYLQIIPGTFQYVYPKLMAEYPELDLAEDVFDPHTNIACALYYMKMIADMDSLGEVNENNIHHVMACYNRGPGGGWKYFRSTGTWVTSYGQRISAIKDIIIRDGTTDNIRM